MKNKYSMTQEQNIFLAKRLLVDSIYMSANLEGIAVTYANTNDILNNVNVNSVTPSDITKICCLRDAWHFILTDINKNIDLGYLEELHTLIARADVPYYELGKIRTDEVLISGTKWRPQMPNPERLHRELHHILSIENTTDKALTATLWAMRSQIFKDGNKRVATMLGNKILIKAGNGILNIPVELDGKFKTQLVAYYETNQIEPLKQWLYHNCIDGIDFSKENDHAQEAKQKETTQNKIVDSEIEY